MLNEACVEWSESPKKGLWARACELFLSPPARRVSVPFYRAKGMVYNIRFMDGLHCKALGGLHHKTHGQVAL
jgi:hypothetical protein